MIALLVIYPIACNGHDESFEQRQAGIALIMKQLCTILNICDRLAAPSAQNGAPSAYYPTAQPTNPVVAPYIPPSATPAAVPTPVSTYPTRPLYGPPVTTRAPYTAPVPYRFYKPTINAALH